MKYEWFETYCMSKPGAHQDYKVEWEATRYMVDGKMFVMIGSNKEGHPIITLKCEPSFGAYLRETYPDIIPGYYMNKDHWNSVLIDGSVPDDILKQMADASHELIFQALSKKKQTEILASWTASRNNGDEPGGAK